MNLPSRLRSLRESRGLSLYRLAKLAGVSQSFLSDLEAGRKWPTIYTLEKICNSMGITLAQFFGSESDFPQLPEHLRSLLAEASRLNPEQVEKLTLFLASLKEE